VYKVLLVEDEDWIREGIKSIIHSHPHFRVCWEASNGNQAIEILKENEPDLLVTDVRMPGLNGLDVAKFAHEIYSRLSSLIISGHEDFTWVRKALKVGSADYLLKPVNKEELLKALEISVERMHTERFGEAYISMIHMEPLFQRLLEGDQESFQPLLNYLMSFHPELTAPEQKKIILLFDNDVSKVIVQKWLNRIGGIICYSGDRFYAVLISVTSSYAKQNTKDHIRTQLKEVINNTNANCYISCSEPFTDWGHLVEKHKEACYDYTYKFYNGPGVNSKPSEWKQVEPDQHQQVVRNLTDQIILAVHMRQTEEMLAYVRELFNYFGQSLTNPDSVDQIVARLLRIVTNEMNVTQRQLWESNSIKPIHWVRDRKTVDMLRFDLEAVLLSFIKQEQPLQNIASVIRNILGIMDREYGDPDLSITRLADLFRMNPSYLSMLFKKETGRNFSNYLMNLRLDESRKLLKAGHLKTYEVAYGVGYRNERAFSRAFKQKFGMSPQEYRK
jgi:two-component system response regulator YesN